MAYLTLNTAVDVAPTVSIANQSLRENQWAQVAPWLTYADAEGDPAVQYRFEDAGNEGANSSYFWITGSAQQSNGSTSSL